MVKTIRIPIHILTCDKCGHEWRIPKEKPLPKVCVKCKSIKWNSGKKQSSK